MDEKRCPCGFPRSVCWRCVGWEDVSDQIMAKLPPPPPPPAPVKQADEAPDEPAPPVRILLTIAAIGWLVGFVVGKVWG
jgi:hypothetical protein